MNSTAANNERARETRENVVRSAGMVSVAVFASRVTGLLREGLMSRLFGAGMIFDAFSLGFRIPNLTRDLFAEGALSSAFVPVFTEYLSTRPKEQAVRLANLVGTALVIVVGAVCALGMIFAPQLVNLLASGFAQDPEKFALAVRMTRIMFPFLLLVALAAQAMGVLNASNRFGVPAMASTFFNIGSVTFGLLVGFAIGPQVNLSRIDGMAIGVVLGGALQLFWQVPSLYQLGFRFRPVFDWSEPGLRRILRMMGPAILGNAATQINVMVSTNFASHLGDGAVSWLGYAFRFMQLPLGLFGVAMASATLPAISRSAAAGKMDDFRRTLSQSLGTVFLLTFPSTMGLVILGKSIIGAVYQGGKFGTADTDQTALALSCYAIGLMGYAALKVVNPAFYALGDSRTPMLISLGSVLVNYVTARVMIERVGMGHQALALSTSAVALFGFLLQFALLRRKIGGVYGRSLTIQFAKVGLASLAMAAVIWVSTTLMQRWLGVSQFAHIADLVVSLPVGFVTYYVCCRSLEVQDLDSAMRAFTAPLLRLLRR